MIPDRHLKVKIDHLQFFMTTFSANFPRKKPLFFVKRKRIKILAEKFLVAINRVTEAIQYWS